MKKNYENLDLEVVEIVDVITTSKEVTDSGDNETPFPTW